MKHLTTLLAALAFPAAAAAQSDIVPSQPQSRPIAIINAVIHTAGLETPVIENGHILFDGGRIMSVGPGAPALPEGCEVVDAKGMHASPGFVALPSSLGLVLVLVALMAAAGSVAAPAGMGVIPRLLATDQVAAGLALLAFGSGPVRGFAVVHCLGILTSIFSAVMVSRGIVHLIYGGRKKVAKVSIGNTDWHKQKAAA